MMQFSQIDQERMALRAERQTRKADDHARLLSAMEHARQLRERSETALRTLHLI